METEPQPNPAPAVLARPSAFLLDEEDYALGCECADPALHIDGWPAQGASAGEPN